MEFNYLTVETWPFFAWLIDIQGSSKIDVLHGRGVETQADFFCEAVWDGDFSRGDLDLTDVVFGSGARKRADGINFVSSGTPLDRLQYCIRPDGTIVLSNSMVCLLSYLNDRFDPTYKDYYADFMTTANGIHKYKPTMMTLGGLEIQLSYYQNLRWDGRNITRTDKVYQQRDFNTFEKYCNFLGGSLEKIFSNAADGHRKTGLGKLGTISKGYDSPTVTALARKKGLDQVIAFDQDRAGNDDCGEDIAQALGVKVTKVPRDAWRNFKLPEIPFVAGESRGEDVQFLGIPDHLIKNSVFLTGYYGDKVWRKYPLENELSDELLRTGVAGLSLTEYRLWQGFIHVPVPFIGARQVKDINRVSHLEEMLAWNVPGSYNRPICRRIVEECGVPRNAFGQTKQVTTVELSHRWTFITEDSQKAFYAWLLQQKDIFKEKGKIFPSRNVRWIVNSSRRLMIKFIDMTAVILPFWATGIERLKKRPSYLRLKHDYWFHFLFPWAVECAKAKYTRPDKLQDPEK